MDTDIKGVLTTCQAWQNAFWANAELPELSWLAQDRHAPNPAQPRYIMHEAVLNALAPAVPLRAVWGGDRRV